MIQRMTYKEAIPPDRQAGYTVWYGTGECHGCGQRLWVCGFKGAVIKEDPVRGVSTQRSGFNAA